MTGGPLIIPGSSASQDVIIGVVSWGIGCAEPGIPGVYSRVSNAYDWIKATACSESIDPPGYLCGDEATLEPTSDPTMKLTPTSEPSAASEPTKEPTSEPSETTIKLTPTSEPSETPAPEDALFEGTFYCGDSYENAEETCSDQTSCSSAEHFCPPDKICFAGILCHTQPTSDPTMASEPTKEPTSDPTMATPGPSSIEGTSASPSENETESIQAEKQSLRGRCSYEVASATDESKGCTEFRGSGWTTDSMKERCHQSDPAFFDEGERCEYDDDSFAGYCAFEMADDKLEYDMMIESDSVLSPTLDCTANKKGCEIVGGSFIAASVCSGPVPTPAFGSSSSSPVSNSLMSPISSLIDPPNGVTWCSGSTNIGRLFSIVLFTWMVLLE
jgi:hypothetical protein